MDVLRKFSSKALQKLRGRKGPFMDTYESERVGHDRVANSFIFKTICSSGNEMERDLMVLPPASLPLWPGPPPAFVCGKALTKD